MESSVPLQIAEAIQSTHINYAPSPTHDINPSTAASLKIPVATSHFDAASTDTIREVMVDDLEDVLDAGAARDHSDLDSEEEEEEDEEDIHSDVLRPVPRAPQVQFPPIPDMRFEQAYLASIRGADTWWQLLAITAKDQVILPLLQGTLYTFLTLGWRHWNQTAQISGTSAGARIRRWWYGVNNWELPRRKMGDQRLAGRMRDVGLAW